MRDAESRGALGLGDGFFRPVDLSADGLCLRRMANRELVFSPFAIRYSLFAISGRSEKLNSSGFSRTEPLY